MDDFFIQDYLYWTDLFAYKVNWFEVGDHCVGLHEVQDLVLLDDLDLYSRSLVLDRFLCMT